MHLDLCGRLTTIEAPRIKNNIIDSEFSFQPDVFPVTLLCPRGVLLRRIRGLGALVRHPTIS